MEDSKFLALKKEAYEDAENNTCLEDILCEHAQQFIDEKDSEDLTDEQREELVEVYRQGFFGKPVEGVTE